MVAGGDEERLPAPGAGRTLPADPRAGSRVHPAPVTLPSGASGSSGQPPPAAPPHGPGNPGDAERPPAGAPRTARQSDSRRAAIWLAATFVGAVGIAVGNDLTTVFAHSPAILVIVLGVVAVVIGALYFYGDMRDRLRQHGLAESGQPAAGRIAADGGPARGGSGAGSPAAGEPRRDMPRTGVPGAAEPGTGDLGGGEPGGGEPGGGEPEAGTGTEPATAVRWWLVVSAVAASIGAAFLIGYWIIGNGFAHGTLPGVFGLAGVVVVLALPPLLARLSRAPRWLSWVRAWRNCVLAIEVSALGLSSGATLGYAQQLPGPVPAAPCPAPTELRVLAAAEILGPLQDAVTGFEQDERAVFGTPCYSVDVTAYAAGNDKAADDGIGGGWNLADGPRPDIWIPASTEEVPAGAPYVHPLGSIASTPVCRTR